MNTAWATHRPGQAAEAPQHAGAKAVHALDSTHGSWDRLLDSIPGDVRGLLTSLQPVWWVVRAWVAWMVVQDVRGPGPVVMTTTPHLVMLGVFLVVSVQVGRGAWGVKRLLGVSVLARLLLIALNIFAVAMVPGAVDRMA